MMHIGSLGLLGLALAANGWSEDYTPLMVGAAILPIPMNVDASLNGSLFPEEKLGARLDIDVNGIIWNGAYSYLSRSGHGESRGYAGIGYTNWFRLQEGFGDSGKSVKASTVIPLYYLAGSANNVLHCPLIWDRGDWAIALASSFEHFSRSKDNVYSLGIAIIY